MLRKKFSIIERNAKGNRILDIGCGTGEFLNFCKTKGFDVSGVELNIKAREAARKKFGLDVREKLSEFSEENLKFDCITLWHVLEHIHELNGIVNSIRKYLKPGGTLIIALPNCNSWDAVYYKNFWAAYDLPRHLYHFNKRSFSNLASKHQLKIIKILPQLLDSFYISLLSEKYLGSNFGFIKAVFNGARSNFNAVIHETNHSSLIYILMP